MRATVLAAAALAAGCSHGPELGRVEGTVTHGGKPLPDVRLVFMPDPGQGTTGPPSTGFTDAEGRYRLRTDEDRPGAVVGRHRVTLTDARTVGNFPGQAAPPPSRLPERYADAAGSPLASVEVRPGDQRHDFEVGPAAAGRR